MAEEGEGTQEHPSTGKKTRTRPIRNAEGVLVRKDGRPDMRSVSSAANLRKVHAKKEAERAEQEGRTPPPLPPTSEVSEDEDQRRSGTPDTPEEGVEAGVYDIENRHDALTTGTSTTSMQVSSDVRTAAERFFPREEQHSIPEARMKSETEAEETSDGRAVDRSSQMTDVVMREMSDAQAAEHAEKNQDLRMSTVEEADAEEGGSSVEQG